MSSDIEPTAVEPDLKEEAQRAGHSSPLRYYLTSRAYSSVSERSERYLGCRLFQARRSRRALHYSFNCSRGWPDCACSEPFLLAGKDASWPRLTNLTALDRGAWLLAKVRKQRTVKVERFQEYA